jgi:hypothetical protein
MRGTVDIFVTLVAWTFAAFALVIIGYLGWKEFQARRRRRRHHQRHRER